MNDAPVSSSIAPCISEARQADNGETIRQCITIFGGPPPSVPGRRPQAINIAALTHLSQLKKNLAF
jgi:hypothetical protein